jgi:hypothetical protein
MPYEGPQRLVTAVHYPYAPRVHPTLSGYGWRRARSEGRCWLPPEDAPEERTSRNKWQSDQKTQFLREDGEDGDAANANGFGQLHPKDASHQTGDAISCRSVGRDVFAA